MKLIYLKPALKCDSFDIAIGIKIRFFRVLVTIEPGRSLLQFVTTNCLNGETAQSTRNSLATQTKKFIMGEIGWSFKGLHCLKVFLDKTF